MHNRESAGPKKGVEKHPHELDILTLNSPRKLKALVILSESTVRGSAV